MLTLKIIIFGLLFIISGGSAFSQLFRDKVWMQVVVGVVGSLSLIFMIREFVQDEMRRVQVSPPVVSAPSSQPTVSVEPISSVVSVPPPQPAVSVESTPSEEVAGNVFQDQLKDGGLGPKMVLIPSGRFKMGSNEGDSDEKPVHWVTVEKFAMGQYEVTFEEYDRFAQATGRAEPDDEGWGRGKRPVINVDWNDAVAYAQWLSQQTGRTYRLPTEAEWEYAARAGSQSKWSFGDNESQLEDYAWYDGNSGSKTHPVGQKRPNQFDLYDMMGNVWEWTHSDYTNPYDGSELRVSKNYSESKSLRGGSWYDDSVSCRVASRNYGTPSGKVNGLGFRVLLFLP